MTEIDVQALHAALTRHNPARVAVYQGDELLREIPVPTKRKRWEAVIKVASRLAWDRCELLDRSGGLMAVIDAVPQIEGPGEEPSPEIGLDDRDARMLKLLMAAQGAALQARGNETAQALQAATTVIKLLTDAIGTLSQIHRASMDAARRELAAANAVEVAPAGDPVEDGDLASSKLVQQLLPIIMSKMLAPPAPAAAPPATPSNGVKS